MTDIYQKLYLWEVYKHHLEMVIYHWVVLITPPIGAEPGIYTGLHDDYDTLFEARHGRGALDPAPVTGQEVVSAPFGGIAPPPSSTRMMLNPRTEVRSNNGSLYPNQRERILVGTDLS